MKINRLQLAASQEDFFEPYNLKSEDQLRWVLDYIQYPLFGVDNYPTLKEKAAKLTWHIIRRHVFWNGNKRTGMQTLLFMMRLNNSRLVVTGDEIVDTALKIADHRRGYSYEELVQWINDKLKPSLSY